MESVTKLLTDLNQTETDSIKGGSFFPPKGSSSPSAPSYKYRNIQIGVNSSFASGASTISGTGDNNSFTGVASITLRDNFTGGQNFFYS